MALPLLGIGAALGGVGSLIGGISSARSQKKAANAQGQIAKDQQQLFQQTTPVYGNLLQQLQRYAQQGPNPYLNNLQLQQAEQNINQNTGRAQDQLSFGLGRRGLTGSSLDVAGRAALLANAENQRGQFQRQLALQGPMEYERRLGLLANLINAGLGQGQAAGATFGQQAGMFGQQAAGAGANIGQSVQNMMMFNALRAAQQQGQPTPFTPGIAPSYLRGSGNPTLEPIDFFGG